MQFLSENKEILGVLFNGVAFLCRSRNQLLGHILSKRLIKPGPVFTKILILRISLILRIFFSIVVFLRKILMIISFLFTKIIILRLTLILIIFLRMDFILRIFLRIVFFLRIFLRISICHSQNH